MRDLVHWFRGSSRHLLLPGLQSTDTSGFGSDDYISHTSTHLVMLVIIGSRSVVRVLDHTRIFLCALDGLGLVVLHGLGLGVLHGLCLGNNGIV